MDQKPPLKATCSVCVANYNGIGLIEECLASIRSQNVDFPVEIIVHDDASDDGSAEYLRTSYPDIQLIESKENVGFCVANNRMARRARGEFLLLLNNDAALLPDALVSLRREALRIDRPAILTLPQYDSDNGNLLDFGSLLDLFLNPLPNLNPKREDIGMAMGACLWIPKVLWDEIGGFPPWFASIGEDLYLCCRSRLAGHPVRVVAHSGYRHRVGASFGGGKATGGRLSTTRRRRALSERNKTFVMLICYPWPLLAVLLPLHMLFLHLEGILLVLVKRDTAIWQEIYSPLVPALWRTRREVRQLRAEVQRTRAVGLRGFLEPFRWLPWKLTMLFRHGVPDVR